MESMGSMTQQRIAVVGAGAIGSYYGMRLAEAGHDVSFLMRRDYDAAAAGGLHLSSPLGDLTFPAPTVERSPEALSTHGEFDWLLIGLKATAIPDLPSLVRPLISERTRVLAIMNGLSVDEAIAAHLPASTSLFGGLGFIGVVRGGPGQVIHQEFGALNIGHYGDDADELQRAVDLFKGSVVEIRPEPSLLKARWEKLGWNIPFNGLCVIAGGVATDQIIHDPALHHAAHEIMREVVAAGNADLAAHGTSLRVDGDQLCRLYLTLTAGMGAYRPSTTIDYIEGRPLEVDAIFRQPVKRATELGIACPLMSMLASLVGKLSAS